MSGREKMIFSQQVTEFKCKMFMSDWSVSLNKAMNSIQNVLYLSKMKCITSITPSNGPSSPKQERRILGLIPAASTYHWFCNFHDNY